MKSVTLKQAGFKLTPYHPWPPTCPSTYSMRTWVMRRRRDGQRRVCRAYVLEQAPKPVTMPVWPRTETRSRSAPGLHFSTSSVVISHSGPTVARGLPSVSPQSVLGHPNLRGCVSLPSLTAVPRLALRRSLRSHVLVVNAILRQCMWVCVPRSWIEAPCVLLVQAWSET